MYSAFYTLANALAHVQADWLWNNRWTIRPWRRMHWNYVATIADRQI